MPKQIDVIKKEKVKQALKAGKSAKQALLDAGYKATTASHSTAESVVKVSQEEILQEIRAKDVGVDYFLNKSEIIFKKALQKEDLTNASRAIENQARFVGIDKQTSVTNIWNLPDNGSIDPEILTKLARRRGQNVGKV
jgi:hypothetical protein